MIKERKRAQSSHKQRLKGADLLREGFIIATSGRNDAGNATSLSRIVIRESQFCRRPRR